jgi:hypothetical protein
MTKPQTKQTITLETIIEAFDKYSVPEAREMLSDRIGARLSIKGVIEKVIKRDGLKLFVKPDGLPKTFMIFADFYDEKERERIRQSKLRKGSMVAFTGDFRTAGYCALTMNGCRL